MSGNGDYGVVREDVLAETRTQARALAAQGLLPRDIAVRLDHDLTATERELLWRIIRQEAAAVHRSQGHAGQWRNPWAQSTVDQPESTPAGSAWLAFRDRWEVAKRWSRERLAAARARSVPGAVLVALGGAVAGIVIGVAIAGEGDHRQDSGSLRTKAPEERPKSGGRAKKDQPASGQRDRPASSPQVSPPPAAPGAPSSPQPQESQPPPLGNASAASLNDRGFQLMSQGRYEEAIPALRQAVARTAGSGGLTYAYALYNLGRSLRLAGRPGEAVPILERRLQIDNQRATVARELEAARRSESGPAR